MKYRQKMLQNVSSLSANIQTSNTKFDLKQYLVRSIGIVKEINRFQNMLSREGRNFNESLSEQPTNNIFWRKLQSS